MKLLDKILLFFVILVISIWIFIPIAPNMILPHTDRGVFLYAGRSILNREIPYRDFWDHKGPIIYYINAFGLLLSKETQWGVWILEIFNLTLFMMLLFHICFKKYTPTIILLAIFYAFLFFKASLSWGDYTEEFNLIFQTTALFLFIFGKNKKLSFLLIGILFALSLLTRPNNSGIFMVLGLIIFLEGINKKNV